MFVTASLFCVDSHSLGFMIGEEEAREIRLLVFLHILESLASSLGKKIPNYS